MKQNQIEEGRLSEHGKGLGTVTPEMVRQRAREIAVVKGRDRENVIESDFEEALRELEGQERLNPTPTKAETLTEDQRWETTPDSTGKRAETVPAADEQTYNEKLVEEGVEDAEHDQALEAERESRRREERS
ncbi:MAG TPA: hypothetical protein VFM25_02305 [Verrucomicrobiae bacterium]|nr:hypothetical protein [Verrucomicrobiae bacterium]